MRIHRKIANRIKETVEYEEDWKLAEFLYGKRATRMLKDVSPVDPLLLRDLTIASYLSEGKSKKEVKEIVLGYKEKDWVYDMEHFQHTINAGKKIYRKRMKDKRALARDELISIISKFPAK